MKRLGSPYDALLSCDGKKILKYGLCTCYAVYSVVKLQ